MTAIVIGMVLIVIVALVIISIFAEEEDDDLTVDCPCRRVADESSLDDLLE